METLPPPPNTFADECAYRGYRLLPNGARLVAPGFSIFSSSLSELDAARRAHYSARAI